MTRWPKAAFLAAMLALGACAASDGGVSKYERGFQLLAAQDYVAAETFFTEILEDDPDDAYAHLNLGAAHEAQGNFVTAEKHYEEASRLGKGKQIGKTVFNGDVKAENTTVASVADYNLANLPR